MSRKGYHIQDQYATYFLTLTIVGWVDIFTRPQCRQIIIDSLNYCKANKGLILYAHVIMSNHIHLIAQTSESSKGMSAFIHDFKKHTAKELIHWVKSSNKENRRNWISSVFKSFGETNSNNKQFQVWKRDNHPMLIHSPKFARQKLNYIHNNPVKVGIVDKAEEYLYSSARNYAGRKDFVIEVELLDLIYVVDKPSIGFT